MVRLSKCSVGDRESSALSAALRREFLGMGADVVGFEADLKNYLGGQREVVCVNSGTAALQVALQACGIGSGDEVLVPTITFAASFQAIAATGARPVACDVREGDCLLDLEKAAGRVSSRTKAVMPVHYAGNLALWEEVYRFAKAHQLRVVEDSAHAFGGTYRDKKVGSEGDLVCFSFDGIKNITCGEGGAVVTADLEVAERMRDARLLGIQKDSERRAEGKRSWTFDITSQGWRYHMSNLNAAVGRVQLTRLDAEFAPRRQALATRYVERLRGVGGLRCLDMDLRAVVPHIFPIFVSGERRDGLRQHLLESGIETGLHYQPLHQTSMFKDEARLFPVAEKLFSEQMSLPLHVDLLDEEQEKVIEALLSYLK
jgi:dTDP-4-amino-4,6-dideoxygalactose transaminase